MIISDAYAGVNENLKTSNVRAYTGMTVAMLTPNPPQVAPWGKSGVHELLFVHSSKTLRLLCA